MPICLNQIFGFCFVPYFDQAFIQVFPSFFVIEHFSLKQTSICLVKASLGPKVLDVCYLQMVKSRDQYSPVGRD